MTFASRLKALTARLGRKGTSTSSSSGSLAAPSTPNRRSANRQRPAAPLNAILTKYPFYNTPERKRDLELNYAKRLGRRVGAMEEAVQRLVLQRARLRQRPNLAAYVAQADANLVEYKKLMVALTKQHANSKRRVWSTDGPVVYRPAHNHNQRLVWRKGEWADLIGRLNPRFTQRNKLLGSETLNSHHVWSKGKTNAAQAALKALTNRTRALKPGELKVLRKELRRVQAKRAVTNSLFTWERQLLKHEDKLAAANTPPQPPTIKMNAELLKQIENAFGAPAPHPNTVVPGRRRAKHPTLGELLRTGHLNA